MKHVRLIAAALSSMALVAMVDAAGAAMAAPVPFAGSPAARDVPSVRTQTTEEGQSVVYDFCTWQRRELANRLPLNEQWPSEKDIQTQFKRFNLTSPPFAEVALPVRLLPDVYLVNTQPNLVYLIDAGPEGLVLIDPGLEGNAGAILKNVAALGFAPDRIKWVINTHAHLDHSTADADFQMRGAKILIGRADVPAVEKATLVAGKYILPALAANYPTVRVDWPVDDATGGGASLCNGRV